MTHASIQHGKERDMTIVLEDHGRQVRVMDSVAFATADDTGHFIVTGSHGGESAGEYASRILPFGMACSDAGLGKNSAGIAGLKALDRLQVLGVGVSHQSARIGDGRDLWNHGVVSYVNDTAQLAGVKVGTTLAQAAATALQWKGGAKARAEKTAAIPIARFLVVDEEPRIVAMDSISILEKQDQGKIIIAASNGGAASGVMAREFRCALVALNDAGIGKDRAGVSGIDAAGLDGIPGVGISHDSAEISNARDMWDNGRISYANAPALKAGAVVGETIQAFARRFLSESNERRYAKV